ncbi:MAG: RND transporter [Isosphaeraceae bacterium]|nr:MAG: RND transporter [Isosphaeraceae bacterium]
MKRTALISGHWWLFFAALPSACAGIDAGGREPVLTLPPVPGEARESGFPEQSSPVSQAPLQVPALAEASPQKAGAAPFPGMTELSVDALVEQVLARNPTLAQMTAAWQAASARYPQVTSLEDPMFGLTTGPASIGSKDVDFANRVEATQKLPFFGKLKLRGQAALAEAAAASNEVGDMRLQLIESAKMAFYDYYLVDRAIAVNEESLKLLREFRKTADDRFRANQTPQQDLLQADVEIGRQRKRGLALERMRKVTQARINTLMHLPPDTPLPPPPKAIQLAESLPAASELRARAVAQRPDLQALSSRIDAERASLGLANKEYYPDFEIMGAYDAFWQRPEQDLRPMLGVRMNVPLYRERRRGAVAEAQARLDQRIAELAALTDQVNLQVQEAYEQVLESEKSVRLYNETILPAARENVKAARTAYAAGSIPFLSLIEAQRNLVELRDSSYEELAEYYRRIATLERVIGGPSPPQ